MVRQEAEESVRAIAHAIGRWIQCSTRSLSFPAVLLSSGHSSQRMTRVGPENLPTCRLVGTKPLAIVRFSLLSGRVATTLCIRAQIVLLEFHLRKTHGLPSSDRYPVQLIAQGQPVAVLSPVYRHEVGMWHAE
jgi:hypothetical protein